jgi:hypothetical protein
MRLPGGVAQGALGLGQLLCANEHPGEIARVCRRHPRSGSHICVGLAWAGNPQLKGDPLRSTTLAALTPLAELSDIAFFSLQFGPAAAELHAAPFQVIDGSSQDRDFAQTAALMATLDLIISVDTSVAHLAGAMGLPLWLLLPHLADWRWMEHRNDSPWYPTARLFRQARPGDWRTLVLSVRDQLRQFADRLPSRSIKSASRLACLASESSDMESLNYSESHMGEV